MEIKVSFIPRSVKPKRKKPAYSGKDRSLYRSEECRCMQFPYYGEPHTHVMHIPVGMKRELWLAYLHKGIAEARLAHAMRVSRKAVSNIVTAKRQGRWVRERRDFAGHILDRGHSVNFNDLEAGTLLEPDSFRRAGIPEQLLDVAINQARAILQVARNKERP
jgi:hypothetical protein